MYLLMIVDEEDWEDEEDADADADGEEDSSIAVTKSLGFLLCNSDVRGDIISEPLFEYSLSDIEKFFMFKRSK